MSTDFTRLKSVLLASGLQSQNHPAFQVINSLIDGIKEVQDSVARIVTSANSFPNVVANGRFAAQTAAKAIVASFTVSAASDASFEVSANVLVTTATTHNFTVTCTYTDEGNTSRTLTLTFSNVGGTLLTAIANAGGAVPYQGIPLHIRAKANTTITIATVGTFTTVTYNVEGIIKQTV